MVSNLSRTEILVLLGFSVALFPFSFFSRSSLIFFARVIISYYKKEVAFPTHLHLKFSTSPIFTSSNSPSWKIGSCDVLASGKFSSPRLPLYVVTITVTMHGHTWRFIRLQYKFLPGFATRFLLKYDENGSMRISRWQVIEIIEGNGSKL